jgi:UDP-GlcNAc:undecaprenyl-phosphate/decaprenyl-phosphate GlcNAc-1-phosphate transferase
MTLTAVDLLSLFIGTALAFSVGLKATAIGRFLGIMDAPDPKGGRKRHTHVTPLVGGIGSVVPALAVLFVTAMQSDFPNELSRQELTYIMGATFILFCIGVIDDKLSLSPKLRLIISIVVFCTLIILVPDLHLELLWFSFTSQPIYIGVIGSLLSILCLVGLLNALNMMDGKNGHVIGITLFWVFALWIHAPVQLKPLLCTMFAALVVLLYFNLRGKLFLGDSGVYGLSALVGMLAIFIYNRRPDAIMADQIILWFSFPVIDCLRVMATRVLSGRSPFDPGRDHFHHYVAKRYGWERGKYICWALVWVPGIISLTAPDSASALLLVVLLVYFFILAVLLRPSAMPATTSG